MNIYLFYFELVHKVLVLLNYDLDIIFKSLNQSFLRFHVIYHDFTVFLVIRLEKVWKIESFFLTG